MSLLPSGKANKIGEDGDGLERMPAGEPNTLTSTLALRLLTLVLRWRSFSSGRALLVCTSDGLNELLVHPPPLRPIRIGDLHPARLTADHPHLHAGSESSE